MTAWPFPKRNQWLKNWAAGLLLLAAASVGMAQTPIPEPNPSPYASREEAQSSANGEAIQDPNVQQTSCSSCGGGLVGHKCHSCGGGLFNIPPAEQLGTYGTGECGHRCYPGKRDCDCDHCEAKTCFGKMCCGFYQCICCPDPCYEPQWLAMADTAFFVDAARPKTQMKLRWDTGFNVALPDRAEYFWARTGAGTVDAAGNAIPGAGKGPPIAERRIVRYKEFRMINEVASDAAGLFVETPYLRVEPEFNADHSGFSDIVIGTKAMLLDCDLLQVTFQFKTYIPSGIPGKGLGTGHTALEPGLLFGLKLTSITFLQAETLYWIPIGGDPFYQGDIFHYGFSLNEILWCCGKENKDYQLIASLEYNGWSIMDGAVTNPDILVAGSPLTEKAVGHICSAGCGLRLFVCDRLDVGAGVLWSLTSNRWADELYRAEFRWRF